MSIAGYVTAQIFYLDDIEKLYFGERKEATKTFVGSFYSINEGTILNINKDAYHLPNLIEAKYLLMPVVKVYELVKKAKENDYSLFADNIRDYLGKNKVNTKIRATLNKAEDRANFFYYNNGITVICDNISKSSATDPVYSKRIDAVNPQIVNGCQTVNTIFEVLDNYSKDELDRDFSQTFVMVKMLQLDSNNEDHKELYEAIVMYNNSQTAISEKQFAANISLFKDLQVEFEKRGFLLAVKQSDKNTFKNTKKFNDYRTKVASYSDLFGLNIKSLNDIIIPLEKLLQVILAFSKDGYYAYTKTADLLKQTSHVYEDVILYLKSNYLTIDNLLCIYLLFIKAEKDKKASDDKKTPIPLYLISFLGRKMKNANEKNRKDAISYLFSSQDVLNNIYLYFKSVTNEYKEDHHDEYNKMIKSPIDEDILSKALNKTNSTIKIFSPLSIKSLDALDELLR